MVKKTLLFVLFLFFPLSFLAAQESAAEGSATEESAATEPAAEGPFSETGEPEPEIATPRTLDVDEARRAILEEDPAELTSLKIGDTDVSLEIHGFWDPSLTLTWGLVNSAFGPGVASVGSPFLFEQEVDLTLALWIRKRWFVEANFQDDNPINTYRAGYQGQEDEFVEYAGVGNTGLDFPVFPYLDMGGSTRSSFGFYGRFNKGPVKIHTLVRYDAAVAEESVFSGGHERNYTYTPLDAPLRGMYFRLPDTNISALPIVYLEDGSGWHVAKPSEASVSAYLGIVELAASPKGRVAVSYPGGYDAGGRFFDLVKRIFDLPIEIIDKYAPKEKFAIESYKVSIMGTEALVLYEKGYFSPFEEQNRYKAPMADPEDAAVVLVSSGTHAAGYDLADDEDISGLEDVYRLTQSGARDDRWPLLEADVSYQLMYLGDKSSVVEDMHIRWTSLSAVSGYLIGEDVLPGSIAVYRSGLRDMDFSFNTATGEVMLKNPAQASETIRITYLRESAERRFGSIAAGLGLVHETGSPFSWRLGLGIRWNTAEDAFSEYGQSNAGRIGAGARFGWQGETIQAAVTVGTGYEENDTTGLYRAAGMEGNELHWMLPENTNYSAGGGAFPANPPLSEQPALNSSNRAGLVYRRYRTTNAVGVETLEDISHDRPVESGFSGPYIAGDKALNNDVLVAEAVLDTNKTWAGYQVPLGSMKETVAAARSIEIPFHLYGFDAGTLDDFTITAQFGPMPGESSSVGENTALIVEREIYSSSAKLSNNCGIGVFTLSNEERRKLQGATHFRLIIQRKSPGTTIIEGRVLLAPLIIQGVKFTPIARNSGDTDFDTAEFDKVTTVETVDSSLRQRYPSEIDRLHPQNAAQRVLKVSWEVFTGKAGADGLVPRLPLENYRSLVFFLKAPENLPASGGFIFQAGGGRERFSDYTLRAVIPFSALTPGTWHKVTLYYGKGKREVRVDGNKIPDSQGGELQYHEGGREETFTYIAFHTDTGGTSGSFSLDEISLEESIPGFWGNAGTTFAWERRIPLLSVGDYTVIENPRFETNIESGMRGAALPEEDAQTEGAFVSRSRAEITVLEANVGGYFNYGVATKTDPVWSGGHSVARKFGPVSVQEAFSLDPEDSYWEHTAAFSGGGGGGNRNRLTLPFSFEARAQQDRARLRRSWEAGLGVHGGAILSLQTDFSAQWVYPAPENVEAETGNYGEDWAESWREMVPDNGLDAWERILKGHLNASAGGEAIGVVFAFTPSQTERKQADNANSATNTSLSFPWTAGNYSGNIVFSRTWNSAILGSANDAGGDIIHYGESLERGGSHLVAPPLYSLFAEETAEMPEERFLVSETFSDSSVFLFTLPRRDDIASFYIPRSVETTLERTVGRRYDMTSDMLDITVLTHFTADNFFGAYGKVPVFRFYQSDELNNMVSYHVKMPKTENASWDVTVDQDLWFFGFYGSSLSLSDTITIGSSGNTYSFTQVWTVAQKNNLPGKIFAYLINRFAENTFSPSLAFFANANRVHQRVEKLTYTYNGTGSKPVSTITIGHESVVRITGHLNFSIFASLDITDDRNTRIARFIGSAGTKLRLSF
jgi:hypothetical protein